MSKLLEIFGKALTVNTADLIWYWLNAKIGKKQCDEEFALTTGAQEEKINEIMDYIADMDIELAEIHIRELIIEYPDNIYAKMLSALICLHKNELENAVKQLQSVYSMEPNNTMALYAIGYCYERMGLESEAVEFYQDCVKFKSYLQLPRQRLAAIHLKNGKLEKAIHEYQLLSTEYPDDISSLVQLGYLQIANLEYDQAIDTFNTAILIHPDNFQSDQEHDDIVNLIQEGEYDNAMQQVQMMMEQLGELPDLIVKMGDIYRAAGSDAESITCYERALQIQPNYMEACVKLGTSHLKKERYALAAENFNRAVENNDEVVDAYIGLAIGQILAGHNAEGENTISLASSIQQNSTLLFAETASLNYQSALAEGFSDLAFMDSSSLMEAVIDAHKAQAERNQESADAFYKLGILLMSTGRTEEAIDSFEKALSVNQTHHRARTKLSICLLENGQNTEALSKIVEPNILDRNLLDMHYQTALLYADRKKFTSAISQLQEKINNKYGDSDALISMQVVLENLGLIDRISTTWERLCYTTHSALINR